MNVLDNEDRRVLDKLSGQIEEILRRLDQSDNDPDNASSCTEPSPNVGGLGEPSVFDFDVEPTSSINAGNSGLFRSSQLPLPDPRLLRRVISQRQLRARVFTGDLFSDTAWDILLDLAAAHAEHKRVSVTSLCIASGVPSTTALRWIKILTEAGLLVRLEDTADKRRAFIALSDRGARLMARYFALAGPEIVCPF